MQAVDPIALTSPATQDTHGVEGSESSSAVPAAHSVHDVLPLNEAVPAMHDTHGVDGSPSKSASPGIHASQLDDPAAE